MREIEVKLATASYKIQIETESLDLCGERIRSVSAAKHAVVITDKKVWGLYGSRMETALKKADFHVDTIQLEPGEGSKTIESFTQVCGQLADLHVLRDHLIIAFGGGVVGDLAGFVAAVYMRGLPFVQIPTTLLAQVDSSVGGKTGIDLPQGKNLLGAFHQPLLVITDPALLNTLDKKQLSEGMAEVIKYGAISDENLFQNLEEYGGMDRALPHMEEIVYRCCDQKRFFVEQDERDSGERRKLNFGHSFGHAIERIGGYQAHTHGEAVAIGMGIAARTGEILGLTHSGTEERIRRVLKAYGLASEIRMDHKALIRHMAIDKKNDRKGFNLILLKDIGESLIHTIAEQELENILEDILELAL
jgi:3-dehydroquinate synthase